MDPVPQGSFIPKQSLTASRGTGGMGILLLLAIFIFIASLAAGGAAFGYERFLQSRIVYLDGQLEQAEGAFNASTINDLSRMDDRLIEAKKLLEKHIAPSQVFYFLSTITLEQVQFSGFDLSVEGDGSATVSMSGTADTYSTVALQSDKFGSSKFLRNVVFSNITVGDSGKVNFSVNATVDPSIFSYQSSISQNSQAAPAQ